MFGYSSASSEYCFDYFRIERIQPHCILSDAYALCCHAVYIPLFKSKCVRGVALSSNCRSLSALRTTAVSLKSAFTGRKCQRMSPAITNQNLINIQKVSLVGQFTHLFNLIANAETSKMKITKKKLLFFLIIICNSCKSCYTAVIQNRWGITKNVLFNFPFHMGTLKCSCLKSVRVYPL